MNSQKGLSPIVIILIIAGVLVICAGIYLFFLNDGIPKKCPTDEELNISGEYKWIDCMPPAHSQNKYCQSGYTKWVRENCPDINFTY